MEIGFNSIETESVILCLVGDDNQPIKSSYKVKAGTESCAMRAALQPVVASAARKIEKVVKQGKRHGLRVTLFWALCCSSRARRLTKLTYFSLAARSAPRAKICKC